jgi:hypothetical protein
MAPFLQFPPACGGDYRGEQAAKSFVHSLLEEESV